uniref:Uncharacterized protein n=1 Tax=Siphoviridae sp. ctaDn21 TaxID=2825563 RepID=A0A8S5UV23_9CAUD|nr:MAG TPA: hypothetical protein [Siphoviridae sp. ctaDn21]
MTFIIKIMLISIFVLSAFCLTSSMIYLVVGKQEDGRSATSLFLGSVVSSVAFYGTLAILVYLP